MTPISRRSFLRLALLGGIGLGAGVIYKRTEDVGFSTWLRWVARGAETKLTAPSRVAISRSSSYGSELTAAIAEGWRNAKVPSLEGARVVIKPNLVDSIPGHPSFTDPRVVEELIRFLRDEQKVKALVVAEGTTFRRDSEAILMQTGYTEMLEKNKVRFVDLNYDDVVTIPLKGGYTRMSTLLLSRTVAEADALISVPKLKTHHWTQISASIKNLFGIVPGIKYGWPKNTLHTHGIGEFLSELLDALPTPQRAAVVDGIVGMEGEGPLFGAAVNAGALVIGTDFVAVDSTCARLMGFDPIQIGYLSFANWVGLGQVEASRIVLAGVSLDAVKRTFKRAAAA